MSRIKRLYIEKSDKKWLIALPGQVALVGLIVFLVDRLMIELVARRFRDLLDELRATNNMWLPKQAQAELLRYGQSATEYTRPAAVFLLAATVLFAFATIALWRGSPRAASAGLILVGVLTPAYLTGLVMTSSTSLSQVVHSSGYTEEAANLIAWTIPEWYAPARMGVLGAAVVTYLMSVVVLLRSASGKGWAVPVPRMVPYLLAYPPLAGVSVMVFDLVGFRQVGSIFDEEQLRIPNEYNGEDHGDAYARDTCLDGALSVIWTHAALFVVVTVIALPLAWIVRRGRTSSGPVLAGLGLVGLPFLLLLLVVSFSSFFTFQIPDESIPPEGFASAMSWYVPAVLTQTALAALAYLTSMALLVKGARRATLEKPTKDGVRAAL